MNKTEKKAKKSLDYEKIDLRASLKDTMKMRSLRTINVYNYRLWRYGKSADNRCPWLHSLKLNLLNGYLDVFSPRKGNHDHRAGTIIEDVTLPQYKEIYAIVKDILNDEDQIPSKLKRNILVKINR